MHRILISDPLHPLGVQLLEEAGVDVTVLAPEEKHLLLEKVADVDALIVRSGTQVTAEVLEAGKRLKVVGRAGIGVDNVDVKAATERGILVVNAPTANLISATEHTFALMLALARNVAPADASMKTEEWNRKRFVGLELQQKTLGVIGFGRIGQQLARRAQGFDMKVVAFDPYLDPEVARRLDVSPVDLDGLLAQSDVITLHTPLTEETRNILSRERIADMKKGVLIVNCARGGLIDEEALLEALDSGQVAGAAFDVYVEEPPVEWALTNHPKVLATPHIGAQTREAQERIAQETVRMLLASLAGSLAVSAVNLPFRSSGVRGEPYMALGEKLGALVGSLMKGSLQSIQVDLWGLEEILGAPVSIAAVRGILRGFMGMSVNYVNAESIARARGIDVVRAVHGESERYPHLIEVTVRGDAGTFSVGGCLMGDEEPRVVHLDSFPLEFRPSGRLVVLHNRDVPGVVGKLGTFLGQAGVNIAAIHLARLSSEEAVCVLRVDEEPGSGVLSRLADLKEVKEVKFVNLSLDGLS